MAAHTATYSKLFAFQAGVSDGRITAFNAPVGPSVLRNSNSTSAAYSPNVGRPNNRTGLRPGSSALGPPYDTDGGDRAQVLDQHPVDRESSRP